MENSATDKEPSEDDDVEEEEGTAGSYKEEVEEKLTEAPTLKTEEAEEALVRELK